MARERQIFNEEAMDIMAEISEEEVNDFLSDNSEDIERSLGIDFETVDNIEHDPFD